jgi:aminoglycoside phosphotransferase family enzyme/predicted kinase
MSNDHERTGPIDAGGTSAAVAETHSGVVFFLGDRAYKLKKPVQFGFLDFRRREVREAICHREVELNRRLAPDVYLGVADVMGPDGLACDHLIVMRRLPADRRLATLIRNGQPTEEHLVRLAHLMATFHAGAGRSPDIDRAADRDATAARWEANATEMARFVGPVLDPATGDRVMELARRYLMGRAPLFSHRLAVRRACDGHGDLLADDIFCLDDGPRVLDCIEFDDHLRFGDGLSDVAFLAMDLDRLGRPELGTLLLDKYREFAADAWPASLAHHHVAYRAQVRAKVSCLRSEQGDASSAEAARALLSLSARHLELGRVRLVVVGGLPGAGKSTLAAGLGDALGAVVLRSDEVRKELAGLDPRTGAPAPFGEGIYGPEGTTATYRQLLARARTCLDHGERVVLDASWHDPAWRDAVRALATEAFADLDELRCVAPTAVRAARIEARAARGADASDATVAISEMLAASETPWPTAVTIDTTPPPAVSLDAALARLGRPPNRN